MTLHQWVQICNPPTWPLTRQQVRQNIRQIGQFIDMNVMVHDMGVDDQLLTNVVQMPVPRISLNRDVYTELLMIESNFGDALLRQNTNGFRELAQAAVSAIVEHARGKDLPDLYLNELAKDGSLFCVPYIDNMPQMAFLASVALYWQHPVYHELVKYGFRQPTRHENYLYECGVCKREIQESDSRMFFKDCEHIYHQECLEFFWRHTSACPRCRQGRPISITSMTTQNIRNELPSNYLRRTIRIRTRTPTPTPYTILESKNLPVITPELIRQQEIGQAVPPATLPLPSEMDPLMAGTDLLIGITRDVDRNAGSPIDRDTFDVIIELGEHEWENPRPAPPRMKPEHKHLMERIAFDYAVSRTDGPANHVQLDPPELLVMTPVTAHIQQMNEPAMKCVCHFLREVLHHLKAVQAREQDWSFQTSDDVARTFTRIFQEVGKKLQNPPANMDIRYKPYIAVFYLTQNLHPIHRIFLLGPLTKYGQLDLVLIELFYVYEAYGQNLGFGYHFERYETVFERYFVWMA